MKRANRNRRHRGRVPSNPSKGKTIDLEKARERCKMPMKHLKYVDDADNRVVLEIHLRFIHDALGGEKRDLYEYREKYE